VPSPVAASGPSQVTPAEDDDEEQDDSWKKLLEEVDSAAESEPDEGVAALQAVSEDSGEDSDEAPADVVGAHTADADRHKRDMDMLMRHQALHSAKAATTAPEKTAAAPAAAAAAATTPTAQNEEKAPLVANREKSEQQTDNVEATEDEPESEPARRASIQQQQQQQQQTAGTTAGMSVKEAEGEVKPSPSPTSVNATPSAETSPSKASAGGAETSPSKAAAGSGKSSKSSSLLGRLFSAAGGKANAYAEALPGGSMLDEDISVHDDDWYNSNLAKLGKDGLPCTKVATNGHPYERRIFVDSRSLTLEIRGGKTGSIGVLLDDLVDIRRGLRSPEFETFCGRFKKDAQRPAILSDRALVLQTPHRTFSFLLASPGHRTTLALCALHLLKTNNRGVMASGSASPTVVPSTKGPKSGNGTVVYANRSTYEGQFHNSMRHGSGTLTLSDGTRYSAEWQNDERHGQGKEFCPDGTTFVGAYITGLRHGHGVMTWPEGSRYTGLFERGRANGEGELLRTDGSVYQGQFVEDCMCGQGRMHWRDGVEYTGQFAQNRREGHGKMLWMSGKWRSYVGQWKDGMQHGSGTLSDHSGQEFKGIFGRGKLERWEE